MTRKISAKVASIFDPTSIAIAAGANVGVQKGDEVIVWRTVDIPDPSTARSTLGSVEIAALKLQVSHVQDLFSIADVVRKTDFFSGMFKSSRVIATSRRDDSPVDLKAGDEVTVYVRDLQSLDDDRADGDDLFGLDEGGSDS